MLAGGKEGIESHGARHDVKRERRGKGSDIKRKYGWGETALKDMQDLRD